MPERWTCQRRDDGFGEVAIKTIGADLLKIRPVGVATCSPATWIGRDKK